MAVMPSFHRCPSPSVSGITTPPIRRWQRTGPGQKRLRVEAPPQPVEVRTAGDHEMNEGVKATNEARGHP